jgi:CHAT domain-containing protein/tetratricopeptide (TPR) repeat protein
VTAASVPAAPAAGSIRGRASRAEAHHAAGVAASSDGRPAAAVRQLRLAMQHAGTDPASAHLRGRILISLAWAEAERGRVEHGFELLDEAEPLIPPRQRGVLHGQRGLLLRRTGRDGPAIDQYDAAIALLQEDSEPEDLAKVLSNRALAHLAAARVSSARTDLTRSAEIASRHGLAHSVAVTTHNLGDLELLRGDIPAALRAYSSAEQAYRRLAPGKLATLAIDRARALLGAGLYDEADRELAVAMDQAQRQRLSHDYADACLARAETALIAGQLEAARRWARLARRRFLRRDNARRAELASLLELRAAPLLAHSWGGRPRPASAGAELAERAAGIGERLARLGLAEDARVAALVAGRALIAAGQPEAAAARIGVYSRPARLDGLDTRLLWRLAQAELADAEGQPARASRHLVAGMDALRRYRGQLGCLDLQTGASVHGADLAAGGLAAALAAGSVPAVFRWSERARGQALLLAPVRPPPDAEAAAALEQLRQVQHAARAADLAGRPAAVLRAQATALRRTIRARAWSASGAGSVAQPVRLGQLRAGLGDRAMVIYLRSGAHLFALVVTASRARQVPLGPAARAEHAVLALRADIDAQAGRALPARLAATLGQATRRDAAALADAVLGPLLPLIGDRELVVAPTGLLVTVPWAMLPGRSGQPVTVVPSATVWLAARARIAAHPPGLPGTALLAAGPGNQRGREETAMIAALRPQAQILTGANATPHAVLAGMDGVSLAHIAAHGDHQPDNPLFSAFELAGGQLMGYDVQQVTAPGTVVLSSCDLGLAEVRPGDETLGMTTALLAAGAGTVVASVTRVGDDDALITMTALHAALARGVPAASALAGALTGQGTGFVCFGAG